MNEKWCKEIFKPKPALIEIKSKGIHLYRGQKYDPTKFDLVEKGWTHEHCDECYQRIEQGDVLFEKEGEIKCKKCHMIKSST